jgi:hypothetical protein
MTTALTREQIEQFRQRLHTQIRRDTILHVPISDEMKAVDQLIDFALQALDIQPRPIEWNDVSKIPDVEKGGMEYFMVATATSKIAFGAYYLNEYALQYEDGCPDATKENGWTPCNSCEEGRGHKSTGWFDETKEDGDRDMYYSIDGLKAWANPLPNPLFSLPKATT